MSVESPDLAGKIFRLEAAKPKWRDDRSVNVILINFGTGVETTWVAISELIVYTIANPDVQSKIHIEIDKAKKGSRISRPLKLGELQKPTFTKRCGCIMSRASCSQELCQIME